MKFNLVYFYRIGKGDAQFLNFFYVDHWPWKRTRSLPQLRVGSRRNGARFLYGRSNAFGFHEAGYLAVGLHAIYLEPFTEEQDLPNFHGLYERRVVADCSLPVQGQNRGFPDESSLPNSQLLTFGDARPHEIWAEEFHGHDSRLSGP
ncbi:hypothetical protein IB278_33255 [Variovorax sp. VRV01]|uniref:hypothetical protein n=1 Tax=Variovorax sp. VRV01 TaxID=2769259 RepID=UPI00177DD36A|nr:hypothetical protein [Variovorax sp. VRV01]MBD9668834.1 hypothetical protein [Variovorax sp. VRV01]